MTWEDEGSKIVKSLSESISNIIGSIVDQFYSPDSAGKIGKGLGEFYKALRESGIPEEAALEMTKRYQSNLTLGGVERVCSPIGSWVWWKRENSGNDEEAKEEKDAS